MSSSPSLFLDCEKNISVNIFISIQYFKYCCLISYYLLSDQLLVVVGSVITCCLISYYLLSDQLLVVVGSVITSCLISYYLLSDQLLLVV